MRRIILVCLVLLLTGAVSVIVWMPAHSAPPRLEDVVERLNLKGQQQDHGWQVCAIGGMINIPGVGQRQQIELCHSDGWRINTYCLDPGAPLPVVGALCSRVEPGSNEFWCGDGVQRILQFAILQTPAPQEEDTPTPTPTQTNTSTSTPILTSTSTPVLTFTVTPATTQTAQQQIEESPTPMPSITPFRRPRAGGPGNIEVSLGLFMAGILATGAGWWFLRWRIGKANR